MFSKWGAADNDVEHKGEDYKEPDNEPESAQSVGDVKGAESKSMADQSNINTILKGSKLTGDINVTCDLELSGDVEGNIRSAKDSNIVIKGTCKGNIETKGGNVDIEGELHSGNIIAGNSVSITGKFKGGEVKAQSRIYVNGEFDGRLEGNEVEIGANAHGKGEIFYKEIISIARGAKVEAQISRYSESLKAVKSPKDEKIVEMKPADKEKAKASQ